MLPLDPKRDCRCDSPLGFRYRAFGLISGARDPRLIQLALKFFF
jgi:hypothetical protein